MRGIAAASILVFHAWLFAGPDTTHGVDFGLASKFFFNLQTGVTLFFVLSGFLLFRPFAAAVMRKRSPPSVGAYFRNRALRILPAYWVILLAVAALRDHELLRSPGKLAATMFLAQDYVPSYLGAGILPAWSLAIEAVFYIAVPLLAMSAALAARRGIRPGTAVLIPIAFMFSLGIVSKVIERVVDLGPVWQSIFPIRADWFTAGMLLAVVRVRWEDGRIQFGRWTALGRRSRRPGRQRGVAQALLPGNADRDRIPDADRVRVRRPARLRHLLDPSQPAGAIPHLASDVRARTRVLQPVPLALPAPVVATRPRLDLLRARRIRSEHPDRRRRLHCRLSDHVSVRREARAGPETFLAARRARGGSAVRRSENNGSAHLAGGYHDPPTQHACPGLVGCWRRDCGRAASTRADRRLDFRSRRPCTSSVPAVCASLIV